MFSLSDIDLTWFVIGGVVALMSAAAVVCFVSLLIEIFKNED